MNAKPPVRDRYLGDRLIRDAATAIFTVLIALLGAVMMTVTSSPLVKGASFMWLPAALQMIAGVWLGPYRGFLAGGIGAQVAGIIAYGGWAPADWIMNALAGGFANSMLPYYMFRWFNIDPRFGSKPDALWRASIILLIITAIVIAIGLLQFFFGQPLGLTGGWAYVLPLMVILTVPMLWRRISLSTQDFMKGIVVAVLISLISAAIGIWGAVVGGQTWYAAFVATGIGWFWGDTVSAIVGLYVLAQFTERAQTAGFAPISVGDNGNT
jgi:hypothetical protein